MVSMIDRPSSDRSTQFNWIRSRLQLIRYTNQMCKNLQHWSKKEVRCWENYSIQDFVICITVIWISCKIFLQASPMEHSSSEMHEKGVHWWSTQNPPLMTGIGGHMKSFKGSTLTSMDPSRQPPLPSTTILSFLLTSFHGSVGYSSCWRRMRHSPSS